jgi:hypothetical protein
MKIVSLLLVLSTFSSAQAETKAEQIQRFVGNYRAGTHCMFPDGNSIQKGDQVSAKITEEYGRPYLTFLKKDEKLANISLYNQDYGDQGETTFKITEKEHLLTIETYDSAMDDPTDGLSDNERIRLSFGTLYYNWHRNDYGVSSEGVCQFEKVK